MKSLDSTLYSKKIDNPIERGDCLEFIGVYEDSGFTIDWYDSVGNILLHLSVRPDAEKCVLNSRNNGRWSTEQWAKAFPVKVGEWFQIKFHIEEKAFRIEVGNETLCTHVFRGDPAKVVLINSSCALWLVSLIGNSRANHDRNLNWRSGIGASGVPAHVKGLDITADQLEPGLSAIIRAKNEEQNILNAVRSVSPYVDEIVLVDNASDDSTLSIAKSLQKELGNLRIYQYPFTLPKIGEQHSKGVLGASKNTFGRFNNWCLAKTKHFNFIRWDADFVCIGKNFSEMKDQFSLSARGDNVALWFSGLEVYQDGEQYWINLDNICSSETVIVSKKHGCRWVNIPPREELDQSYLYKANKIFYEKPVYYEIFRLDSDEFHDRGFLPENVRDRTRMEYRQYYKKNGKLPSNFCRITSLDEVMTENFSSKKYKTKVKQYILKHYSSVPAIIDSQKNTAQVPPRTKNAGSLCIGIMTSEDEFERHWQMKSTWIQDCINYGYTYYFVIGRPGRPSVIEDDVLYLDCPDDAENIRRKFLAFSEYILNKTNFSHIFLVDCKTLVNVDRIATTPYRESDIVFGSCISSLPGEFEDHSITMGDSVFLSRHALREMIPLRNLIEGSKEQDLVQYILNASPGALQNRNGFVALHSKDVLTHNKYLGEYLYISDMPDDNVPWRPLWWTMREETEYLRDFTGCRIVTDWYEKGAFRNKFADEEIEAAKTTALEEQDLTASSA